MEHNFFRSLVLTIFVFSMLQWIYIILRILVNNVNMGTPFTMQFRSFLSG